MLRAGVGTVSVRYLRSQIKALTTDRKRPLIGVIEYAPSGPARGGRYEYVYYLKPYGKKLLLEQLGIPPKEIRIPVGHPQFHRLYHHRRMQVDFHISLYHWCGQQGIDILLYENDFDTIGGNRSENKLEASTKISFPPHLRTTEFIIPDGVFILNTPQGKKFFLTEFHRGHDVQRAVNQLYYHALAIGEGLPSKKYGIEKSNRVLTVFEHERTMLSVRQKLNQLRAFQHLTNHFLFTLYKSNLDFGGCWISLSGEKASIF